MNLEDEAKQHFAKLAQKLSYLESRLADNPAKGIAYQIQREIDATKFVIEYAKEALSQRGVKV
jgi:ABC-type Fe3+-hydroxamate transport system substrate-binding protein